MTRLTQSDGSRLQRFSHIPAEGAQASEQSEWSIVPVARILIPTRHTHQTHFLDLHIGASAIFSPPLPPSLSLPPSPLFLVSSMPFNLATCRGAVLLEA